MNRFHRFNPVYIKWSSQLSTEERERSKDRYSLTDNFVMLGFARVEDQREAIIRQNRKQIGFRGPRLSVQRYIAGTESSAGIQDKSTVLFGVMSPDRIMTKAEQFHRKIQDEEEQRNRDYRSGIVTGETNQVEKWMRVSNMEEESPAGIIIMRVRVLERLCSQLSIGKGKGPT
jgi:hypothetical protein